jgi:hypothetical protein
MKKHSLLFLLLLLVFTVISCSKDSSEDGNTSPIIDKSANLRTTGSSANDILSNTNFDKLLIEVAYVTGFSPTQTTMDNFTNYLREHTLKEDIEFIYKPLASPNETSLSLETISDLESEHRTAYNNGKTLAIYIYFADAPSDGDDEDSNLVTLGAVYRNTSMIIYEATLRKLARSSTLISVSDVETATLNHEFGHLFGLVDLGSDPVNEHEDPEAENHCTTPGCLMRAELQFGGGMMKQMEFNKTSKGLATIPVLDAECIADLRANGGR